MTHEVVFRATAEEDLFALFGHIAGQSGSRRAEDYIGVSKRPARRWPSFRTAAPDVTTSLLACAPSASNAVRRSRSGCWRTSSRLSRSLMRVGISRAKSSERQTILVERAAGQTKSCPAVWGFGNEAAAADFLAGRRGVSGR
ncbi:hypothetical protein J2S22_001299 [Rhodoplanes tepidamans]|nr:hypothetical protein [Rhodoplanes tepidamans]